MSEIDDIREFLMVKGVKANCPRCFQSQWTLNSNPSPWAGLWGAKENGQFGLDGVIHPVIFMICDNCGFVSPHSKHVFEKWKRERGGKL